MPNAAEREIRRPATRDFVVGLGRAFAGAVIFSIPILMTMEMWWLGFVMDPLRLGLLILLTLPLLVRLSRYEGFRETASLTDDIADAFVAMLVAFVAFLAILWVLGVFDTGMPVSEIIAKTAVQMVPGSIGAMLAQNQLGGGDAPRRKPDETYSGEIFLMIVGALFLSFSVAPTEEVVLIAYRLTALQELALLGASLALMHAFVYALEFSGSAERRPGESFLHTFLRFTVVGYALVFLVSLFVLWCFGRMDGIGLEEILSTGVVLSFPGAIGASVARLIL
ncbi:TIGR02587 family membrane protein [Chthonobacter albigriseus]|uniref:TIGR02587 family membrane protein n=1 Tax=Chthonobacter albigriseus TaxID=1683161 RepID=UPI0015EEDCEA|nr:TIGR02587 family membrane protein [Chthonobacter albigriseus]